MTRLALKNVTMNFGSIEALKNISLETKDGEFLVILGPAGAGKTTLLKVMAGIYKPTRGRVFIDEDDITDIHANKRNVAMTFEDYALYPTFTVRQNIENPFGAMAKKPSKAEIEKKINEIAIMLKIDHLLDRNVDQLSGGEKQRVSLARSVVRSPRYFLFDEPLSHVDAKIRHTMRAELHSLASVLSTTIIYVTHDYVEALSLADRIVVLNHGEIQQIGKPYDIYFKPANEFVAKIAGQPNINMFTCSVQEVGGKIVLQDTTDSLFSFEPGNEESLKTLAQFKGKDLKVGIRPQKVDFSFEEMKHGAIKGKVELYELWGYRGMILVTINGHSIRVLMNSDVSIEVGTDVWIDVSQAPLYLFDPETGERIECGGNQ